MILQRISVAGFRTFAEPVAFTPDARFTVIYAPNGTGKSTLLEALYYGLLERHTITGDGANKRFKSLGRDLTPTIEIDFTVAGVQYRLRKAFLKTKSASLQRWEAGRYVSLVDGVPADDFVRQLFCAVPAAARVIDADKHFGFHHVLFAPARAKFTDLPEGVGDQIRSMLGGAALAVTDGERNVQELAASRYGYFYTGDGKLKAAAGSANIPALEATCRLAKEGEVEARRQYARLERLNIDYMDRAAEAQRMNVVRDGLRVEIEGAKRDVDTHAAFKQAGERATHAEAEARLPYERINAAIKQLTQLRAERGLLVQSSQACSTELERLATAAADSLERCNGARTAVEDAGAALAEVQRRAGDVTAAEAYVASTASADRLQSMLAAYEESEKRLVGIRAAQAETVAPDRAALEALRTATNEFETLQRTIAAAALSLEIEAETALTVEVVTGEKTGPLSLLPGAVTTISAAEESVVVDVPGLGRIRARGTDGAAKARKQLRPLAAKLEAARELYGTLSIPELAGRSERAEELQRSCLQAQAAMSAALEGRPLDDVRALLAQVRARFEALEAAHPTWRVERPDAPVLRAAFDRDLQTATDASRHARIGLSAAEEPRAALEAQLTKLRTDNAQRAVRLETNATQLATLESDGHDDVARAQQEQTLALLWVAARAELANVTAALARFTEDPRVVRDRLEEAEREAGVGYEKALGEAKTCHAQLEMQANLGSYARLAAAEELAAQGESDLAAAQAQANAIACLYLAFDRVRTERVAAIVGPITVASTQYLTRITGSPIGRIEIGSGLAPDGLVESVSGMKILMDGTLSTGEKEQIYLATRLALADVIAKERGRQLFVIDDSAPATDPNRLRRFIGILEELSQERLQIIVTTADRSRYLGIKGAKHFDLAAALLGEVAA
jgi:energy-coupling factor transporter ATP-binding protein EcfA2